MRGMLTGMIKGEHEKIFRDWQRALLAYVAPPGRAGLCITCASSHLRSRSPPAHA